MFADSVFWINELIRQFFLSMVCDLVQIYCEKDAFFAFSASNEQHSENGQELSLVENFTHMLALCRHVLSKEAVNFSSETVEFASQAVTTCVSSCQLHSQFQRIVFIHHSSVFHTSENARFFICICACVPGALCLSSEESIQLPNFQTSSALILK
jgi:hypothetical protein